MRRFLAYALCIAGMIAFYFCAKFLAVGISEDFGLGAFVGAMLMAILFWINERVSSRQRG